MPTVERTDRWRPSAAFGLCVSGVVLGFVIGGFQGAFGAFVVAVGVMAVRRARRNQASIPRAACTFLVLDRSDDPVAAMLFRLPDGDTEAVTDHLRERGWSTLEPPLDGPLAPVGRVGVAFQGDRILAVHDLRGIGARPILLADRVTDLPPDWGRAAQQSGYVLLLVEEAGTAPGAAPSLGAYALLQGMDHAGRS
ncbi:hypothetical protein [Microbacterium sp. MYb62]|uniref:hypothetical protein n=1 Tax=Microbacterium sp. MYb62 TaxID=1848690 RepID=UPI000CFDD694|nr:hypothetical protein [Microbacterium sp. MYb62]PRB18267.1 hypothetical protein CQ042_02925 [Microbacterium sp. MYb62]